MPHVSLFLCGRNVGFVIVLPRFSIASKSLDSKALIVPSPKHKIGVSHVIFFLILIYTYIHYTYIYVNIYFGTTLLHFLPVKEKV